jgi:hypothetical protein
MYGTRIKQEIAQHNIKEDANEAMGQQLLRKGCATTHQETLHYMDVLDQFVSLKVQHGNFLTAGTKSV